MKNLSNFLFSGILAVLPNPSQWREVRNLEILVSFLVSVLAGIVTYYICKWLDDDEVKRMAASLG